MAIKLTVTLPFVDLETFAATLRAKLDQLAAEGWTVEVVPCGDRGAVLLGRREDGEKEDDAAEPEGLTACVVLGQVSRILASLPPIDVARRAHEAVRRIARLHPVANLDAVLRQLRRDLTEGEPDPDDRALYTAVAAALEIELQSSLSLSGVSTRSGSECAAAPVRRRPPTRLGRRRSPCR